MLYYSIFCFLVLNSIWRLTASVQAAYRRHNPDDYVQHIDIRKDCLKGVKTVRNIKTGAAILVYNESLYGRNLDLELEDFKCHYEIETISEYGFHVYFDELYLSEEPMGTTSKCVDYVQFGRDKLFITTQKSQEFCGTRSRVTQKFNESSYTGGQGLRMYVEEKDSEMDIWIQISRQRKNLHFPEISRPRVIMMTVTAIKKDCGAKNPFYKQCSHTDHCIRREFFCDGRINCAWPDAEKGGTDEVNCGADDEPYRGPFNTKGAANVPLIIVMIIVATAFLVVILIFSKKFLSVICKASDLSRTRSNSPNELPNRPRRASQGGPSNTSLPPGPAEDALLQERAPPPDEDPPPTAPPSYEEVIKDNPGVLSRGMPLAPPPYSESITMTQV